MPNPRSTTEACNRNLARFLLSPRNGWVKTRPNIRPTAKANGGDKKPLAEQISPTKNTIFVSNFLTTDCPFAVRGLWYSQPHALRCSKFYREFRKSGSPSEEQVQLCILQPGSKGATLRPSAQHSTPIESRQEVRFNEVHAIAFLGLVERERFLRVEVVIKFRHDQSVITRNEGAGSVTVVFRRRRTALHRCQKVLHQDWGFLANGGSGFGSWQAAGVADSEDIRIANVAQGFLVHIDPTIFVCQRAALDEIRGTLGRRYVDHVVAKDHVLARIEIFENGFFHLRAQFDEIVPVFCFNSLSCDHLVHGSRVFFHVKTNRRRRAINDLGFIANARLAEVVVGQIHNFLGSATTLEWRRRLGENRDTALEIAYVFPGGIYGIVRIVAANSVLAKTLF